jgi:hypothetical protein
LVSSIFTAVTVGVRGALAGGDDSAAGDGSVATAAVGGSTELAGVVTVDIACLTGCAVVAWV